MTRDPARPLACVPGGIPETERAAHFALARRLFHEELLTRRRLADGHEYEFAGASFDDVARWVGNERRCCPFLAFSLEVAGGGGSVILRVAGGSGVHDFLDAVLLSAPG